MRLLSIGTNAKTIKSDARGEYLTGILYMAPHTEAGGKSLCPHSTAGCREACLYTAGRGSMNVIKRARIARAQLYLDHKTDFLNQLHGELLRFTTKCSKAGLKPAVRLNGTTDIMWEAILKGAIFTGHPKITFYDYTKIPKRMLSKLPVNYSLTFSRNEESKDQEVKNLCGLGKNVAVVFDTHKDDELPKKYLGIPVIDGRTHDLRFLDEKGVIVGLSALGKGRKDTSGFVVPV